MIGLFGKKEPEWTGKKRGRIFTIQLSDELYNKLDEVSRKYGIPKAQLVRDALIEKLARLEGG
jgi:predicted DNA-binding protein